MDSRADDVLVEVWNKPDPYFTIGERFRLTPPGRFNPWRVEPDDKKKPTHLLPGAWESVIAIFPEAIAIGSPVAKGKSVAGWGGMISSGFFAAMMIYALVLGLMESVPNYPVDIIASVSALFFILCFFWCFRRLFLAVSDWPIVFNRKTRQITYLPAFVMPFLKFWKAPPQEWRTVKWDDVKARTYKHTETNAGKSFHDAYHLFLLWGGEGGEPHALNGYVAIGNEGYFEDETLWVIWEHIRRYMEEGGPPIQAGEALRPQTRGKPIMYPSEVVAAAGGPALSPEAIAKMAG
jgi:hypothetical protein